LLHPPLGEHCGDRSGAAELRRCAATLVAEAGEKLAGLTTDSVDFGGQLSCLFVTVYMPPQYIVRASNKFMIHFQMKDLLA
jgi:hypothetical protein